MTPEFSQMKYIHHESERIVSSIRKAESALARAKSFDAALLAYSVFQLVTDRFSTAEALASLRHELNTADSYYKAETEHCDEISPEIEEAAEEFNRTLLFSPFRADFEAKFGSLLLRNAEISQKAFSPAVIDDMKEENRLVREYDDLRAEAQIEFEGKTLTLPEIGAIKESPDDGRRAAAWRAEAEFFAENTEKLDSIFDRLTAMRTQMGRKLGFSDFTGLGYCRMGRNCYTPAEIAGFRQAIAEYIVPIADRLYREQAARLGVKYPMSYPDSALEFRSGNPKPVGTPKEILAVARDFYEKLSPETKEFSCDLFGRKLIDVISRPNKGVGGFCTYFPDYKAPFIFANFNGTSADVETVTHEAGHAFAAFMTKDIYPGEYRQPTLDACEIHSMTMEFFAWEKAEEFYGGEAEKFKYSHLAGAVRFLPYGALVDHFQHSVYEKPEMSPMERCAEWMRLQKIYMPWLEAGELPFYGEGRAWQRQGHIYEVPFYYIDYCLAETVALEFFGLMQKDRADAWERYLALVKRGGSGTLLELCEAAGLPSPLSTEALKAVADGAVEFLDSVGGEIKASLV